MTRRLFVLLVITVGLFACVYGFAAAPAAEAVKAQARPGLQPAAAAPQKAPAAAVAPAVAAPAPEPPRPPVASIENLPAPGTDITAEHLLQQEDRAELLYRGGLYIPTGDRGFNKYTQGQWKTGWADGKNGDRSISHTKGGRGKLFVPVLTAGDYDICMRLEPSRKLQSVTVAVENKDMGVIRLANDGWQEHCLTLKNLSVGDTVVDLRMNRTKSGVGPAIDWLWFGPAGTLTLPEAAVQPEGGTAVQTPSMVVNPPVTSSGAVYMPPGGGFRLFMYPHKGLWLRMNARGPGSLKVTAANGRTSATLYEGSAAGATAVSMNIDAFADAVMALTVENTGDTPVTLGSMQLMALEKPLRIKRDAPRPDNVILYLSDTLRRDKLTVYNPKTRVKTPNFSRFAKEGVVFDQCYVQGNWSKASSAAFFTGLYAQKTFAETTGEKLSRKLVLLPERLKKAKIKTGAFISNGYLGAKFGFRQGWDKYRNPIRENLPSDTGHLLKLFWPWFDTLKADDRYFVYLGTIDPHVPYDPPASFLKMYDKQPYDYRKGPVKPRKTGYLLGDIKGKKVTMTDRDWFHLEALYDGEVSYNDDQLGKLWAELKKRGKTENTMLIITSDHGDEFRDHGSVGHGHTVYQELIHMPLIVYYPPLFPAGLRIPDMVEHIDITATILDAMGLPVPDSIDGESFLPLVADPTPHRRRHAFSTMLNAYRTVMAGKWKLLLKGPVGKLYDIEAEAVEKHDVRRDNPMAAAYLRGLVSPWIRDTARSYTRKDPLP